MQQMQANLHDTVGHLGSFAAQLNSIAKEMTTAMHECSSSLNHQNDEIEMAATAVTEMSHAVDEVATNAASTSTESRRVADSARQGLSQPSGTLNAIGTSTEDVLTASASARADPQP